MELGHEVLQELSCRVVGDLPVVAKEAGLELDVRLNGVHLRGIAEGENTAQMLLAYCRANLARRRPDRG